VTSLPERKIIKPPALRPGDKIGALAPASSFTREAFLSGIDRLRKMGYEPVYNNNIFERDLYFAGTARRRTEEFSELWQRDDVAALVCVRGGYGSNYLLDKVDFAVIAAKPKIVVGCSDITSLLTAIHDRTGLVTFHGPMVAKDIAEATLELFSWNNALLGGAEWSIPSAGVQALRPGRAQGRLYGGCLSMLAASLGTPYEIATDDTILFIEDVAEKPFRIDRMLMQLRLAGKLDKVRGFVFGQMLDCVPPAGETYTLLEVIMRVLGEYDVPVAYGLKSGHVTGENLTLPLGVRVELSVENLRVDLKVLEPATVIR
jgi:muramoyltetrapeptide carboxypeptidase